MSEPFCLDCPDHEACSQSAPCELVKRVNTAANVEKPLSLSPATEPIHDWFGLTYANYLVLPRSVLQSMPVEWQRQFVARLQELGEATQDLPTVDYNVETVSWYEPDECTPAQLKQARVVREGNAKDGYTYYSDDGNELDGGRQCVPVPVRDPNPHYSRGRTRVELHDFTRIPDAAA